MTDRLRILLADDHAILRDSLRAYLDLQPDLQVVGEAADGPDAIQEALRLRPDLILLDMAMPRLGGLEVTRRLKQDLPQCKIVILSQYDDADTVLPILQAGADGYVVKRAGGVEVLRAIRAVANGDVYLDPSIVHLVLQASGRQPKPVQDPTVVLTRREQEVLALIGAGKTNQQIADALFISMKTVDKHRANLLRKLSLPNRAALIHYAVWKTRAPLD